MDKAGVFSLIEGLRKVSLVPELRYVENSFTIFILCHNIYSTVHELREDSISNPLSAVDLEVRRLGAFESGKKQETAVSISTFKLQIWQLENRFS